VAEVANSWRTTGDHQDAWSNTIKVIQSFWAPSNPGVPHAWNYGDFLMTGGPGCDVNASWHCPRSSDDEYRTAFATWAIAASPLIVATDIRNMTAVMKQCLLNQEAIFINQDHTMPAGKLVGKWRCSGDDRNACAVMSRPLSDGTHAALLSNLKDDKTHNITVPFEWLSWGGGGAIGKDTRAEVRNVLLQEAWHSHWSIHRRSRAACVFIPAHQTIVAAKAVGVGWLRWLVQGRQGLQQGRMQQMRRVFLGLVLP